MDKVLLLGHTGFLGSAVSSRLSTLGIPHTGISLSSGYDLRIPNILEEVLRSDNFTSVINCAAHVGGINYGQKNSQTIFEDNTVLNLHLLKAVSNHRIKLINPISNCAYPGHLEEYRESEFWNGQVHESVFAYATTRRQLVSGSILYSKIAGFNVINLAIPNIYGPGDHLDPVRAHALGGMLYRMIKAKRANQDFFEVWGSGKPIREWIYVDDVAAAVVKCLTINTNHYLINIGTNQGISISNLAAQIQEKIKFEGKVIFDITKPDGADKKLMIATEAPIILKWVPTMSFEDGLSKTVDWFEKVI